MTSNVLNWNDALSMGHQPGLYSYRSEDVPIGEYLARLDFKIWAKEVIAISCYFSVIGCDKKIQLTVYCTWNGRYRIANGNVNFVTCPAERIYLIKTIASQKKKDVFNAAMLIDLY